MLARVSLPSPLPHSFLLMVPLRRICFKKNDHWNSYIPFAWEKKMLLFLYFTEIRTYEHWQAQNAQTDVHQTTIRSWPRRPLNSNKKIIRKMLFSFLSSNLIYVIISELAISDNSILNNFNNNSGVGSEDLRDIPKESSDLVCPVFMSSILAGL